jgi:hypothetical protein
MVDIASWLFKVMSAKELPPGTGVIDPDRLFGNEQRPLAGADLLCATACTVSRGPNQVFLTFTPKLYAAGTCRRLFRSKIQPRLEIPIVA